MYSYIFEGGIPCVFCVCAIQKYIYFNALFIMTSTKSGEWMVAPFPPVILL